MKKVYSYILILASLAFVIASCTKTEEAHQPGEPDVDGCYGVYFPSQDGDISLDPSDPTTYNIKVSRTNTSGAITVPFEFEEDSDTPVFTAGSITFNDGQSETTVSLSFPSAVVGVSYTCHFLISDSQYASKYSSNAVAFDFTVIRDKWNSLGNADFSDYWMFNYTYQAELLQNDKDKDVFRLMHPYDEGLKAEGYYPDYYKAGPSDYLKFELLNPGDERKNVKVTMEDLVIFDLTYTGYYNTSYSAEVFIVHPGSFTNYQDESYWTYSKVMQYQDNGLPAAVQLAPEYYMNGVGGLWHDDHDPEPGNAGIVILYPGAVLTDYSLTLTPDFASGGVLPMTFELGTDVAEVKYASFEGELNEFQAESRAADIADGTTASSSIKESGTVNLSYQKTGVYSIVAVIFDKNGDNQGYTYTSFSYVASGEEVPVVINAELLSTKKYETLGYKSDNTLEYTIFGSDITAAKVAVYLASQYKSDPDACVDDLTDDENAEDYSLDADAISSVNSLGYMDIFTKLNPGTEYVMLVWASNGYEQKIIRDSASTTGEPLPIYMNYTMADIDEELLPQTSEGYFGDYDFYAIDYNGDLGAREKLSTITISDNSLPDSEGSEFVTVRGLFAADAAKYHHTDSVAFEFYHGVLYQIPMYMTPTEGGQYYPAVLYASSVSGKMYLASTSYAMLGGYVCDGHIAFVVYNTGVNIDGWCLHYFSDEAYKTSAGNVELYFDPMFVKKGIYSSAASSVSKANAGLKALDQLVNGRRLNYVESEEGYVKSRIDDFRNSRHSLSRGISAGLNLEAEHKAVSAKVISVSAPVRNDATPRARVENNQPSEYR